MKKQKKEEIIEVKKLNDFLKDREHLLPEEDEAFQFNMRYVWELPDYGHNPKKEELEAKDLIEFWDFPFSGEPDKWMESLLRFVELERTQGRHYPTDFDPSDKRHQAIKCVIMGANVRESLRTWMKRTLFNPVRK